MGKIFKIASVAICCVLMGAFSACSDNLLSEGPEVSGADMDNMVEVDIPFSFGKGVTSHIVTRANAENGEYKDSQLTRMWVFAYENRGGASENDKLVFHKAFETPLTSWAGNVNGWMYDDESLTRGKMKLKLPTGDLYIYVLGNYNGSFVNFFPNFDMTSAMLNTRKDFLTYVTPEWNGNMFAVDGYLPLVGVVNNGKNGACKIVVGAGGKGKIESTQAGDDSFLFKRLMCKVSMKFKNGPGVKFTPKSYRFLHCGKYIAPIEGMLEGLNPETMDNAKAVSFDALSPDSLMVYLPENIRECVNNPTTWEFAFRDEAEKENGLNKEDGNGHYLFKYAPQGATYVEILGEFTGGGNTADTKYILHLGDFRNDLNEFSLKRDHHYKYTVTVNGVNDIIVEVEGEEGKEPYEKNPAVEGIVFKGGIRVQLDSHYEQVEMHLKKTEISQGIYILAKTPFGDVSCRYLPESKTIDTYPEGDGTPAEALAKYKELLKWIEFKKQTAKGTLATYKTGTTKDVFAALDEVYEKGDGYYTCFVDEYYYAENPVTKGSIKLSDFVNVYDRIFGLGSDVRYSQDKHSVVSNAVYVLQQHAIACFYDLDNDNIAKYGVEIIDEIAGLNNAPKKYGTPKNTSSDVKNGIGNTNIEVAGVGVKVNWAKNGFLLDAAEKNLVPSGSRLNEDVAYLACLTRNRDFDGNGIIDEDELRWYTPARDQMLGLWIGEPSLPTKAVLCPLHIPNLGHLGDVSNYPIFTSTNGGSRIVWAEEGCAFGQDNGSDKGYVRIVRNLGATPSANSHTTTAQPYYRYDKTTRIIDVYLNDNALRAFSGDELAPHHERSVINRPHRKFQVAKKPYYSSGTTLKTTNALRAKTDVTTIAAEYSEGTSDGTAATWRLPNQREMALMIVAMGDDLIPTLSITKYSWVSEGQCGFHTRTAFSSTKYHPYGFMYWRVKGEERIRTYGNNTDAGYFCVRDVQR